MKYERCQRKSISSFEVASAPASAGLVLQVVVSVPLTISRCPSSTAVRVVTNIIWQLKRRKDAFRRINFVLYTRKAFLNVTCKHLNIAVLSSNNVSKRKCKGKVKAVIIGIALGYGLDDRDPRVRFPAEAGNISLYHRVQKGSRAHPASYPMGTRGSFPGGKAAGAWSWQQTSIYCRGQRMSGATPPLPNTPSWRGTQLKHRDNTFTSDGTKCEPLLHERLHSGPLQCSNFHKSLQTVTRGTMFNVTPLPLC
jgi:hypothetical protein